MRALVQSAMGALAVACAPLQSEPLPDIGPPEYGRVTAQRALNIRSGETAADRAAWSLLAGDPLMIVAAVVAVEDELGRSQITEYDIDLMAGGTASVRSRYVVDDGACVMMRRPTGVGYVLLVRQDENRCEPPAAPGEQIQ